MAQLRNIWGWWRDTWPGLCARSVSVGTAFRFGSSGRSLGATDRLTYCLHLPSFPWPRVNLPTSFNILSRVPPWATALAARESLLWGNEHRCTDVTSDSLRLIINAHNDISDGDPAPGEGGLLDIMIRLAYEQFPYQEWIFEEVSRSHALMVEGAAEDPVRDTQRRRVESHVGSTARSDCGCNLPIAGCGEQQQGVVRPRLP